MSKGLSKQENTCFFGCLCHAHLTEQIVSICYSCSHKPTWAESLAIYLRPFLECCVLQCVGPFAVSKVNPVSRVSRVFTSNIVDPDLIWDIWIFAILTSLGHQVPSLEGGGYCYIITFFIDLFLLYFDIFTSYLVSDTSLPCVFPALCDCLSYPD